MDRRERQLQRQDSEKLEEKSHWGQLQKTAADPELDSSPPRALLVLSGI